VVGLAEETRSHLVVDRNEVRTLTSQLGRLVLQGPQDGCGQSAVPADGVDERTQTVVQCGQRVGRGEQFDRAGGDRVELLAGDCLDQRFPGREMPVKRADADADADADAAPAGDLFQRGVDAVLGEGEAGLGQQAFVVAAGRRRALFGWSRWGSQSEAASISSGNVRRLATSNHAAHSADLGTTRAVRSDRAARVFLPVDR
jgi:hypothetical protein